MDGMQVVVVGFVEISSRVKKKPKKDRAQRIEPMRAVQNCKNNRGSSESALVAEKSVNNRGA